MSIPIICGCLMQKSGKAVTFGAMDLVEYNMRTEQQQPGFDSRFYGVIGKREYEITRNYGYEMQEQPKDG